MEIVEKNKIERLHYIDQLKGIAIFFVVMGHFIQFNISNYEQNTLFKIIYSFHMPFFMFLSGYVAHKTTKPGIFQSYFSFIQKKAIALLIPFFSWPLLILPFVFESSYHYNPAQILINLFQDPGGGLWYLWYLFFLYVQYSFFLLITIKLNQQKNFVIDTIVCLLLALIVWALGHFRIINYSNAFLSFYFFFFVGVFVSKYQQIRNFVMNKVVFAISLVVFVVFSKQYHLNDTAHLNLAIKLFASIAGTFALYNLVNNICWNKRADKILRNWGRNTIIIYVTQFVVISLLPNNNYLTNATFIMLLLITFFFSIIIILICLGISKIIELSSILNLIFYGKTK